MKNIFLLFLMSLMAFFTSVPIDTQAQINASETPDWVQRLKKKGLNEFNHSNLNSNLIIQGKQFNPLTGKWEWVKTHIDSLSQFLYNNEADRDPLGLFTAQKLRENKSLFLGDTTGIWNTRFSNIANPASYEALRVYNGAKKTKTIVDHDGIFQVNIDDGSSNFGRIINNKWGATGESHRGYAISSQFFDTQNGTQTIGIRLDYEDYKPVMKIMDKNTEMITIDRDTIRFFGNFQKTGIMSLDNGVLKIKDEAQTVAIPTLPSAPPTSKTDMTGDLANLPVGWSGMWSTIDGTRLYHKISTTNWVYTAAFVTDF